MKPRHAFAASLLFFLPALALAANITHERFAPGAEYETSYRIIDSGQAGPTVLIIAGRGGDEGPALSAMEQLERWPLQAGRIVVFPTLHPLAEADDQFFQRFGKDAEAEGYIASAAFWDFLADLKPDYLLKLRGSREARSTNPDAYGNTILAAETPDAINAASASASLINRLIDDESLRFHRLRRPAEGSLVHAAADRLEIHSMWIFIAQSQPETQRRDLYTAAVYTLLERLRMVETGQALPGVDSRLLQVTDHAREGEGKLRIALFRAHGVGGNGIPNVTAALAGNAGIYTAIVDDEEIRRGLLDDFHVAVFTGGSGSAQAASLREEGRQRVRAFVEDGGGYIGICAGAYLACSNYTWGLKIIDAQTRDRRWRRGRGYVETELTDAGRAFFGDRHSTFTVRYANGPIIEPAGMEGLLEYTTLAYYRTELAENETIVGLMDDTPAIATATFGRGRVVFISPHPESSEELHDVIQRCIEWAGTAE